MKLRKAEYESDIDSPYDTEERKKHRRDNAKIQFSDQSDSEEQIRDKRKRAKPKIANLPSLPQAPDTAMNCTASTSKTLSCSTMHNKYMKLLPSTSQKENVASALQLSDNSDNEKQTRKKTRTKSDNLPLSQTSHTAVASTSKTLSCSVTKSVLRSGSEEQNIVILPPDIEKGIDDTILHKLLKGVEYLKVSMNGLTSLVRECIQRLDNLEKNTESLKVQSVLNEYDNVIEFFPIKNTACLTEVENLIKNNPTFKETLIKNLTQITSADMKKTIRNILHFLISDEMAQQFSWLGQRHKTAFHNLQISKILTLAVKLRHQDTTLEQVSSIAAEWLKHAKQRLHRQIEKERKNEEAMPAHSDESEDSS